MPPTTRHSRPRIALYQPDIAANTGSILRTAACFELGVDIIGPAGFDMSDRALSRAGLDYADKAVLTRHIGWTAFLGAFQASGRRLVLLTTHGASRLDRFAFTADDTLLFGRESAGVPPSVHDNVDHRVCIPLSHGNRSLNLAVAAGIASAEALRQTAAFP